MKFMLYPGEVVIKASEANRHAETVRALLKAAREGDES